MKRIHRASAVFTALIGALVFGLAGCTADVTPSAPRGPDFSAVETQPADLLGIDLDGTISGLGETLSGVVSNLALYRCSTPSFGSVTQSVGPAGGVVTVGPHSLVVPPGALDRTVAITASTKAADHVGVDFQPEGLRFNYPAVLRLSYAHCDRAPVLPKVVYVDDLLSILELLPTLNDPDNDRVTTRLRHFSGYALAD
ncbi:MAG: hypothetical protein ABR499_21825 [Gemmatimonadaceae bacterium]